jgi:hypothetical protein
VRSDPVAPLYERCCGWIAETFERAGTSANMSGRLHHLFLGAGLPAPVMQMQAVIGNAESAAEWLRAVAELTIVLAPAIERQGLASFADIGCETLSKRLVEDVAKHRSMIIGRAEIGAWARLRS